MIRRTTFSLKGLLLFLIRPLTGRFPITGRLPIRSRLIRILGKKANPKPDKKTFKPLTGKSGPPQGQPYEAPLSTATTSDPGGTSRGNTSALRKSMAQNYFGRVGSFPC
ncbi:hypothetical protein DPMN_114542 [Dreissena polymorpha]|uniref:Uncharacterized protein n=1 Tax=Dreissena polymorpha TaxID=45954 RepID=A0A9D4KJK0_DREPO|nr:hypothetical protein DPMN_114542 [Dreissena polymorpha]